MRSVTTDRGITWHFDLSLPAGRQGGEVDTLLFLHGWGVSRRIWRQQVKHFSQSFRVLAVDLPGHGDTSWRAVGLGEMAEDLSGVLDHLKLRDLRIVASSFGGLVALKIFEHSPERVAAIAFVGSQPKFVRSDDHPFGLDQHRVRDLARQLEENYPAMVHIFFRSLFTLQERRSRRYRWIQTFRQPDDVPQKEALLALLTILEQEDLRDVLKSVNCPVGFLNGTDDYICPKAGYDRLAREMPEARFVWFEECGHFPFLTRPHEFNKQLERFLSCC